MILSGRPCLSILQSPEGRCLSPLGCYRYDAGNDTRGRCRADCRGVNEVTVRGRSGVDDGEQLMGADPHLSVRDCSRNLKENG